MGFIRNIWTNIKKKFSKPKPKREEHEAHVPTEKALKAFMKLKQREGKKRERYKAKLVKEYEKDLDNLSKVPSGLKLEAAYGDVITRLNKDGKLGIFETLVLHKLSLKDQSKIPVEERIDKIEYEANEEGRKFIRMVKRNPEIAEIILNSTPEYKKPLHKISKKTETKNKKRD